MGQKMQRLTAGLFAFSLSIVGRGAVVTSVDLVDPGDGIGMPPAGHLAVDVTVDLTSAGDEWTAAGMQVGALNGAMLVYRLGTNGLPNLRNPNAGNPAGNRTIWATSISNPNTRDDNDSRFSFADCSIAGAYSPAGPPPATTTATTLNVAWFRTPDGTTDVDGAVARIVVTWPLGGWGEPRLTLGTTTPPPSHPVALLVSVGQGNDVGTVNASVMSPTVTGINWVLSIPEPGTVALLGVLGVILVRRRELV
jgi:hypothetical protein